MFILCLMSFIIFFISCLIMMLASFISKPAQMDREKTSPFECGFDPMNSSRIPFSIQFFLITIIFLIFDVEITLILPLILIFKNSSMMSWMFTGLIFMAILISGLYHEWNQGMLSWTN